MDFHTIRIRSDVLAALRKIAAKQRGLRLVDTLDILIDGWNRLTPEQQEAAIRQPPAPRVDRRRKAVAA